MQKHYTLISYFLFLLPLLLILNFLFEIVTLEKFQGLVVFLPLLFCSAGLFFSLKAYENKKKSLTLVSIIANSGLILFPFLYMVFGTVIFGV